MQLIYDEIVDILDVKHITDSTNGYSLPVGKYEVADINWMLKSLLQGEVEVFIAFDDFRLRSNLVTDKTIQFTKKFLFYTILCFTQSDSGPLGKTEGFIQLKPRIYKSDKIIKVTGSD